MALRLAMLKIAGENMGPMFGLRRWAHAVPLSPPMDSAFDRDIASQPLVIPEFDKINNSNNNIRFPGFFGGSMELMAVPKRKVSPHKRGIRNGPKALKPVPVIVRCKGCGRVKLPHFFCCSGDRGTVEQNN